MLNEVEDWQEKLLDPAVASELNFFEVTIASVDQPKLLSRLSEALVRPAPSWSLLKYMAGSQWPLPDMLPAGGPEPQHL